LVRGAAEQRAEHRDVAEPGQLILVGLAGVLQQAAEHETLAVAQFHRGRGLAHRQRRDRDAAGDGYAVSRIELAHVRLDHEIDLAAAEHGGREGEADAVFLVFDRGLAKRAGNRDRIFTAGQEARGIARQRGEIGLRQAANQTLLLERIELDVDRELSADQAADQEAERRRPRQHAGRHDRGYGRRGGGDVETAESGTGQRRLLERAVRCRYRQLRGWSLTADIGENPVAEHVPLHAELTAGLPRRFDETHFQHDLLRLRHLNGIDDVRRELLG